MIGRQITPCFYLSFVTHEDPMPFDRKIIKSDTKMGWHQAYIGFVKRCKKAKVRAMPTYLFLGETEYDDCIYNPFAYADMQIQWPPVNLAFRNYNKMLWWDEKYFNMAVWSKNYEFRLSRNRPTTYWHFSPDHPKGKPTSDPVEYFPPTPEHPIWPSLVSLSCGPARTSHI